MAASNPGKRFEDDFRNSVPPGVYCYRLRDAGGWASAKELRFTPSNDYDHLLYKKPLLFTLELKSVAERRWPYSSLRDSQREGLLRAAAGGAVSGVLLNFRSEGRTFFIPIRQLLDEEQRSGKKSLNLDDAARIAAYELRGELARTRFRYAVADFVDHFIRRDSGC